MDGGNNGKPYEQMDDLGIKNHYFWFNTQIPSLKSRAGFSCFTSTNEVWNANHFWCSKTHGPKISRNMYQLETVVSIIWKTSDFFLVPNFQNLGSVFLTNWPSHWTFDERSDAATCPSHWHCIYGASIHPRPGFNRGVNIPSAGIFLTRRIQHILLIMQGIFQRSGSKILQ